MYAGFASLGLEDSQIPTVGLLLSGWCKVGVGLVSGKARMGYEASEFHMIRTRIRVRPGKVADVDYMHLEPKQRVGFRVELGPLDPCNEDLSAFEICVGASVF